MGCLLACSLLASESSSREPPAFLQAAAFLVCHPVSFSKLSVRGQGYVPESLGPQPSESSQLACAARLVVPLAKRADVCAKSQALSGSYELKRKMGPEMEWVGRRGGAQKRRM